MKLLTVTVPCYNAQDYMERCLESIVPGGDEVDLIIVDDGSTDRTGEIADRWAEKHPDIVRVIHQENGGHGEGLNQGIKNARGLYFKTVDSDDRLDPEALKALLKKLREHTEGDSLVDLIVNDYVYDREDQPACFSVSYRHVFSQDRVNTWESCRAFPPWKQFMIHSMAYRTQMLRDMGLVLPKHTFYEDNLYIYRPLPYVKKILYLDRPLYGYFIGRADQSVNDKVIVKRLAQVTNIAREMITSYPWRKIAEQPKHLRDYMLSNIAGQMYTTSALQYLGGEEGRRMNRELREAVKVYDAELYRRLKHTLAAGVTMLPGALGRGLTVASYRAGRRMIRF
ncbi:MAG: glycosyltransferase [Clostridia bacterium]|nr:glycosyltransferase [Clostridia bacterium]